MEQEKERQLLGEILGWAAEMWDGYDLYVWARNRGMTHEEACEEFYFDDKLELKKRYEEEYNS